jgi:CBS-domain-containing membrane protein
VHENAYIDRVYSLFRNFGLRHLPVINDDNELVGMLTRKEVMTSEFHVDLS